MVLPFYDSYKRCTDVQTDHPHAEYRSSVWPGLRISAYERHIKASSPSVVKALSSAVYGGGMIELDRIFNIYVDRHYRCDDPPRDIADLLTEWQEQQDQCAGLLTAVRLEHTAIQEYKSDEFGLLCCTTAGVSNAARAGSARTVFDAAGNEIGNETGHETMPQKHGKSSVSSYTPGTINIMLWMNGCMTAGAMVNAVQTAVEAKAAALADFGVVDSENGLTATGTTTDAIVLAVSQSEENRPLICYAGTATVMGAAIGRLVYDTITESLQAAQEWKERNNKP
ncbi:adenosylcobinamide amidohydrolase [Paenibacillus sp. JNUCC31]|uniref:adenosylcobinamide amidohydrolase n=1 Tax=Paenibacillus sp. JNUCC-31 TaxID=2777983 RepID=UPI001786C071|nr:adenosylcobinamide amidohydrolase [Paenibacillus sp. JNUCC-31]QOS77545.1 adenosylcobinamide amidohydrolase [Paenibacillus sp. JNUCC-31]